MKSLTRISLFLVLIVAVSCRDRSSALPLSDYVSSVLTDTSYVEYHLVKDFVPDIGGSLAVVGDPQDVMPIVEDLICSDRFDNIDGRAVSDGLTDFAGEHVAAYMHESLLSDVYSEGDFNELARLSVKEFIASIDTGYLYSPYDRNSVEHKTRAKLVVLATPFSSVHGLRDIDTLCQIAGLEIPVVSAADEMMRYLIEKYPQPARVCLWASADRAKGDVYGDIFLRCGGIPDGLKLIVPSSNSGLWLGLLSFLDKYMEDGSLRQISAIAVDDPGLDPDELRAVCDSLRSSTDEALIKYRNLLAKDFELVFPSEVVSRRCYGLLRESNSFTHRVAAPETAAYRMDDTTLVRLRDVLISDELRLLMEQKAPKALSRYVRP